MKSEVYKVAYDHPNDDLGTTKFFDEGLSRQDKLKIIKEQLVRESDFPEEIIMEFADRFRSKINSDNLKLDE